MQSALQPYATAGVAIVGASLIAATPLAAPLPGNHTVRDVALTSTLGDLLGPWIAEYNTAAANATIVANNFFAAPGVGLQQAIVNQVNLWQQLLNDPTVATLTDVTTQMQENAQAVASSATLLDADADTAATVTAHTLVGLRSTIGGLIGGFLPPTIDPDVVNDVVNFISSPLSGIIIGQLGPLLSPWVALSNSISDGDGLNEILAHMVGAFFNGADLDLDNLLPAINGSGFLPEGMVVQHLDLALGGLFSPGTVTAGPFGLFDSSGAVSMSMPAVGGSIFNSLGLDITGVPVLGELDLQSEPIGPLGAYVGYSETIGVLLGSGWDQAGSGKHAPPETGPAYPPLANLILPYLPDSYTSAGDDSSSAAAVSLGSAFNDFFSGGDSLGDVIGNLVNSF